MRQRELILLIQSSQSASSKAKIGVRAVGLLNMYLITPYLPSHGKSVVSASEKHSPRRRQIAYKGVQSHAPGTWRTEEGGFVLPGEEGEN